jgi:hypothetical protein
MATMAIKIMLKYCSTPAPWRFERKELKLRLWEILVSTRIARECQKSGHWVLGSLKKLSKVGWTAVFPFLPITFL